MRLFRFHLIVPGTCANLGAEMKMLTAFPGIYICSNPMFRLVDVTNVQAWSPKKICGGKIFLLGRVGEVMSWGRRYRRSGPSIEGETQ
jgi:hypothetical protein